MLQINQGTMIGASVLLATGVVAVLIVRHVAKKEIVAAAETAGGILSGNNTLTEGTPYEGMGVLGTLGAAANTVSGGVLEKLGGNLGGLVYDWFN